MTQSTAQSLSELAGRVGSALGPDRELDWRIAEARGHWAFEKRSTRWPPFVEDSKADRDIPAYTASLDAAMSLVPEGWETAIYLGGEQANVQMETEAMRNAWFPDGIIDATAATPALALCAAALRSLAGEG